MKIGVLGLGLLSVVIVSGRAVAQEAPPARRGFEMALRTGYSIPFGSASQGQKMSDFATGQVPLIVDVGGKVLPELFIGGYVGLAFGGEAGAAKQACDSNGGGCVNVAVTLVIEAQYHILPAGKVNPWLGYGIGIESIAGSAGNNGGDTSGFTGWQYARFSGGVDFRLNRVFGVGPFVDLALGDYSKADFNSTHLDIAQTTMHEWLTIGARFVFLP